MEHWTGLAASDVAVLCISLLTCNNALAARHTSISTSRTCSCPLYRRAEDRVGTLSIMLLYQAARRADRIGKICTALTNGPQGNDAPDHQPFTTLLLQLGGKSEIFALWWDRSNCAFCSLRSLLARFWYPLSTGEKHASTSIWAFPSEPQQSPQPFHVKTTN